MELVKYSGFKKIYI